MKALPRTIGKMYREYHFTSSHMCWRREGRGEEEERESSCTAPSSICLSLLLLALLVVERRDSCWSGELSMCWDVVVHKKRGNDTGRRRGRRYLPRTRMVSAISFYSLSPSPPVAVSPSFSPSHWSPASSCVPCVPLRVLRGLRVLRSLRILCVSCVHAGMYNTLLI